MFVCVCVCQDHEARKGRKKEILRGEKEMEYNEEKGRGPQGRVRKKNRLEVGIVTYV